MDNQTTQNQTEEQNSQNQTEPEQSKETEKHGPTTEGDKKYSDKDLDDIIAKKFAKWQEKQDKAVADAKAEAERLAKMDADEKAKYEAEKRENRIKELEARIMHDDMAKVASAVIREAGMKAPESLDNLLGEDEESTRANAEAFVKMVQEAVEAQEKKRATGSTPKNYGNSEPVSEMQKRIEKYRKR